MFSSKPVDRSSSTQTRCFSLVTEVVDCACALMDSREAIGKVVNIGSTEEITILELARRVRELSESSSDIVKIPYEEAYPPDFEDMQRRVPDVSRLLDLTGLAPEASIEDIIRKIIESGVPEGSM